VCRLDDGLGEDREIATIPARRTPDGQGSRRDHPVPPNRRRRRRIVDGVSDSFPRLFARTQRFTLGAPRNFVVSRDGMRVVFLRSPAGDDPTTGLWVFDVATGDERCVVDPGSFANGDGELPPAERARRERLREAAQGITSFAVDKSCRRAVFTVGGRLVTADLGTGEIAFPPAADGAYDPRLDATGTRIAYVAGDALRISGPDGDRELLADPDPDIAWGVAEFVAAEEMGRTRGHWWSPDGTLLLAARVDNRPVNRWFLADPTEPGRAPRSVRYPAAGTANAVVTLAVVDLDGSRVDLEWQRNEFEYLATATWRSDDEITLSVVSRDQRTVAVLQADPHNGDTNEIHRQTDADWVEPALGTPEWAGERLVTIEPRDGNLRLCLDGAPVSPEGLEVTAVIATDEHGVTVVATMDPRERHIARIDFDGGTERITDTHGVHRGVERNGTTVIVSSTPETPGTVTTVRSGERHHVIASHALDPGLVPNVVQLELGERRLNGALVLPREHDGTTLPVLLDPYGGPHSQRAIAAQSAYLASQWFADQGFAVLILDGRGTPGRGTEWERAVAGDLAQPALDDQVDGLLATAQQFSFLDLGRVGIRGWSFGGYLAALAVLRRPDVFHAAIAGAPVTDWRLYDTFYTERYLGHPASDPQNYERSSLVAEAHTLERPIQLIHGLADDNVVAAHTLQFSRALLEAGKPHEVLPLSGVSHMTPQEVVAENLLVLQVAFLRRSLGAP
jgi:dipeptidyl-peptidase-4